MEAAYLDCVRSGMADMPPLFLDQLVHVILRHRLAGCDDPIRLRAAELLFREQKVTIQEGAIMLADEETVEMRAPAPASGSHGLLVEAGSAATASSWTCSTRRMPRSTGRAAIASTPCSTSASRAPGLDALCRVLETWVGHFTGAAVGIQPVQRIDDERWIWHVGLDAEASALLNDLYEGAALDEARRARLLALFRLEFRDPADMLERVRGRPVYLGLAMTGAQRLKLKPQNLLVNLPLARPA